eukprot:CFRG5578T1
MRVKNSTGDANLHRPVKGKADVLPERTKAKTKLSAPIQLINDVNTVSRENSHGRQTVKQNTTSEMHDFESTASVLISDISNNKSTSLNGWRNLAKPVATTCATGAVDSGSSMFHSTPEELDSDEEERQREEILRCLDEKVAYEQSIEKNQESSVVGVTFQSNQNSSSVQEKLLPKLSHKRTEVARSFSVRTRRKPKATLGWMGFTGCGESICAMSDSNYSPKQIETARRSHLLLDESQLCQVDVVRLQDIHDGLTRNIAEMQNTLEILEKVGANMLQKKQNDHSKIANVLEGMVLCGEDIRVEDYVVAYEE